jgi:pimeloyl-ACP methyl ester carboxylesterase
MLTTSFVTVAEGRRVRLARLGDGPPVVLLHGYPDNLEIWCKLAPRLADRFSVLAPDWPGLGYSDEWPGGATPMLLAERLRHLLDAWQIDRASLVGLDMGGQPALAFASLHPERIDRLVVMNSLVFGDEKTSWEIRLLRKFGCNRFILRTLPGTVFRRAEKTFLPPGVRLPRELRADLWESFRRPEVRRFLSKMCAGYQGTLPRLPELYRQVRCPVLVLWGDGDKHFPIVQAERLHESIPGSTLQILAGGTHWMAWHRAEEVAGSIAAFLLSSAQESSCCSTG